MQTTKLFQNGRSQAVRIPKEFRFEGTEVYITKMGRAVVLLPLNESWDVLFDSLHLFSRDFMDQRAQPALQQREELFAQ